MAHSFFNATTGGVWPLNVTLPLPDSVARTARHAYYASVSFMDYQVGRVLDELDSLGLRESTIVLLHGDVSILHSTHLPNSFFLKTRPP